MERSNISKIALRGYLKLAVIGRLLLLTCIHLGRFHYIIIYVLDLKWLHNKWPTCLRDQEATFSDGL